MLWWVVGEVDGHFEGFLLLSGCGLRVAWCLLFVVVSFFVGRGFL